MSDQATVALGFLIAMEAESRKLPKNWGYSRWSDVFPKLAYLLADRNPALTAEQGGLLIQIGALINAQMTKELEAQGLLDNIVQEAEHDRFVERLRRSQRGESDE